MNSAEVLIDGYGRVREVVEGVLDGLTAEDLAHRVGGSANSIGWLVWHLTRVQDDHVAGVAGSEQVWTSAGWAQRFGLPFDVRDIGYGHTSDEVGATRIESADLLLGYHQATHERTVEFVRSLADADLDRIVDTRWTPPVTLGVRLVSVIGDDLQHAGQAAFVRGLLAR